MSTNADLELIQELDFEPMLECEAIGCENPAEWAVVWSCGCNILYCDRCQKFKEKTEKEGRVKCDRHGIDMGLNRIVSTERIRG